VLLVSRRDLWKAPEEDGGVLVDPPLERAEELLEINRRRLQAAKIDFGKRSFQELRQDVRARTLDWAVHSLPEGALTPDISSPIIASGHQPELYHPGVWIKDFAVDRIAEDQGAVSLHVPVDTDLVKSASVAFPIWSPDPQQVSVEEWPYDEFIPNSIQLSSPILDAHLFQQFPESTRHIWSQWSFAPLLPNFWDLAVQMAEAMRDATSSVAFDPMAILWYCFSSAKRSFQVNWGCNVAEVQLSRLPTTAFVVQVLSDLPRFHAIYNECIRAYRRARRLRSSTHPVPDLAADGEFLEAPFWWLDPLEGDRHRLFVRARADSVVLTRYPPVEEGCIALGAEDPLNEMASRGFRIGTRVLTTTMFLRLCVADLFIHGIGGAKYDELTDDIIRRYFGIEPPEYMVVSGTLRLPFQDKLFPRFGCNNPRRKARDVLWNPQRYLRADDPTARQLAAEKQQWIEREPANSAGRQERFYQLHNLTMRLRDYVSEEEKQAEADLQRCKAEVAANKILTNREYSFVLYPEEKLRPFLTQFLK
jgi:hypothetical protein